MFFEDDSFVGDERTPVKGESRRLVRRLLPYFKKYGRKIAFAAGLLLGSTVISLFGPLLLRHAIDVDIRTGSVYGLARTSIIYLLLQVTVFLVGYFQRIQLAMVGEKATADLKESLYRHTLNLPMGFFDKNPVGRLITRVESDTEALKNLFTTSTVVLVQDFVLLVGMSVVMALVNYKLYLIVFVLLPPFVFSFFWFQKRIRPIYRAIRKKIAEINNFINESLKGLPVIQAFWQEITFAKKMDRLNKDKYDQEMRAQNLWYRIWFLVDLGEVLGLVLVLGIGGFWALKSWITIGTLVLFASYITRLFMPLRGLSDQLNVMQRAFASAERIFGLFDTKPEEEIALKAVPSGISSGIEFRNVNFAYEGRELVLKDINFRITRGEKVALVGETGGGKTSIVSLLLKFYTPGDGKITVDGQDLAELNRHELRRQVGFVPQDVVMFPGSVFDNLRLFDETVPPAAVYSAAERAKVHERILSFPQGYETNLVEQGINLSLGERQLLAFARALVLNPAILVLDEATSSVDPHTERLIQDGLKELLKGRTGIIIAHRLATIQMVDRIIVIHHGKIIEEGNHRELLRKRGFYYRLYRLQYLSEAS
jgi:ATP-binding cassette subfamily B protein